MDAHPAVPYELVVEADPDAPGPSFPVQPPARVGSRRMYFSTVMALILAILGSSVLPMAYAFSKTGVLLGIFVAVVVAVINTYTCVLLLNAAERTRRYTYEELTCYIGGTPFMMLTQASNMILLFGNLVGDMCLLADLGSTALVKILGDGVPAFLVAHQGRGIMIALTCAVIFPLSLLRGMRALEYVSSAGVVLLFILAGIITWDAAAAGFPGLASGEVPLWRVDFTNPHIPEAFALVGFSFYLHPLMMPLLQELPHGTEGVRVAASAVKVVILGVALLGYSYIGVMGAAAFGAHTEGDIMMNQLVHGRTGAAVLVIAVLIYIASCIPPLIVSMRCYLDFMIAGPRARFRWPRFLAETTAIVFCPMFVAMFNAGASRAAFAVTGATGVCIVCYIIPVVVHTLLRWAPPAEAAAQPHDGPLLHAGADALAPPRASRLTLLDDALPWAVLVVGCVLSGLALWGVV